MMPVVHLGHLYNFHTDSEEDDTVSSASVFLIRSKLNLLDPSHTSILQKNKKKTLGKLF